MDVKEDTKRSQGGTGRTTASKGGRSSAAKRSSSKTAGGTAKGTRKQTEERKRLEEERRQEEARNRQLRRNGFCLGVLVICILLTLGIFQKKGFLANISSYTLFGMFGLLGYIFPVFFLVEVFFSLSNRGNQRAKRKLISGILIFLVFCAIWQLLLEGYRRDMGITEYFTSCRDSHSGGGLLGGIQVYLLCRFLGIAGAWVVLLAELVLLLMYFTEKFLFSYLGKKGIGWLDAWKEKFHEMREARVYYEEEEKEEPKEQNEPYTPPKYTERRPAAEYVAPAKMPQPERRPLASFLENDFGVGDKSSRKDFLQNPETGNVFLEESDSKGERSYAGPPKNQEPREYRVAEELHVQPQKQESSMDPYKAEVTDGTNTEHRKTEDREIQKAETQAQTRPAITITRGEKKAEEKKEESLKRPKEEKTAPLPFYERELALKFHGSPEGGESNVKNHEMDLPDSLELDIDQMIQEGRQREEAPAEEYFETDVLEKTEVQKETEVPQTAQMEVEVPGEPAVLEEAESSDERGISKEEEIPERVEIQSEEEIPENSAAWEDGKIQTKTGLSQEVETKEEAAAAFETEKDEWKDNTVSGYESPEMVSDQMPKVDIKPVTSDIIERPQTVQPPEGEASGTEKPKTVLQILEEAKAELAGSVPVKKPKHIHQFPPIDLLNAPRTGQMGDSDEALQETANRLQMTLDSFKVKATVTNASCGPQVTRFEVQPEPGVKVSKITGLADDIKLNLAAADIRIEAPIPGKAAVGIEVPNKAVAMVTLRELLDTEVFKKAASKVTFAVGKDISGQTVVTDIAKMPHLLIAGSTGSGKSVCINTLIMSILYKADPEEVKLIMVDPKVVELSIYNGIPHLLIPVVTDPNKALGALNWAVAEMEDRYAKFKDLAVRDLKGYNEKIKGVEDLSDERFQKLPQIVIILDELADLMMVTKGEVETPIVRLSQKARAAGIHLIIATQRPSVDVITGLIKANVPSRIAFLVSSQIDSRTILDTPGAEHLIGKGDMLFAPAGFLKPARVQGAFVSDEEVNRVVGFLTQQYEGNVYDETLAEKINSSTVETKAEEAVKTEEDGKDEYFKEAARLIVRKKKASIGLLQRAFKIGYNRAARMMDQLCEAGIVGEEQGTKPRELLVDEGTVEELLDRIS